jgi:hypothetical protein
MAFFLNFVLFCFVCFTDHAEKLHQLPDEYLADMMPIAKKIAVAQGAENYNVLQVGVGGGGGGGTALLFFLLAVAVLSPSIPGLMICAS